MKKMENLELHSLERHLKGMDSAQNLGKDKNSSLFFYLALTR